MQLLLSELTHILSSLVIESTGRLKNRFQWASLGFFLKIRWRTRNRVRICQGSKRLLYYATIPLTCKIQNRSQFLSRKPSTVSFNQPKSLIYLFIKISSYLFNLLNIFIFLLLGHYHIAGLFQVPQQTVVPTREKKGPGQSYCAGLLIMLEGLIECLLLRIKSPEHTISLKITTTCPYQIAIKKTLSNKSWIGAGSRGHVRSLRSHHSLACPDKRLLSFFFLSLLFYSAFQQV